jgi:hypothetical protein
MRELRDQGATESLEALAACLTAYTRRSRLKELVFAVILGLFLAGVLMVHISPVVFLVGIIILGAIFWGPVRDQLNPSREVLLRATIALLDGLTRTDLPGLLALLHALEQGRPDSENRERRVRFAALRLLSKNLIQTPHGELAQLTAENRRFLGRELKRLLHAPTGQADLDIELPIRLFVVLTELREPGLDTQLPLALAHSDERLQEAAREYQAALNS